MIFIPDADIERFLLEDIAMGDVTSRSLQLTQQAGHIQFFTRQETVTSGVEIAKRILLKLGLEVSSAAKEGEILAAGQLILSGQGQVAALQKAWKVAQNILEWSCGVAQATASLLREARSINPQIQIACTRKSIPGTRLVATTAVLNGGGIIHRAGTAETILVFANHRHFLDQAVDWCTLVETLRIRAPEKKIVLEADTPAQAREAMRAQADIVQLDKFTPEQIMACLRIAEQTQYLGKLIAAGGIHQGNMKEYAATGVPVLVTSSPYYAKPADIKVVLRPINERG